MSPAFLFPRRETDHEIVYSDSHPIRRKENGEEMLAETEGYDASLSLSFLVASTCGLGGLQVVWSVILSNGAPFLMSLGLSKSLTPLIWVAGPLCGVAIQPLMGALSDRSRNSMGRRRPYILGGALGTILSMGFLAWLEESPKRVARLSHGDEESGGFKLIVTSFAIFGVYMLNISIQPLQMGLRTLIVESCPKHQQTQASACASRLIGVGNIIGYLAGFTKLSNLVPAYSITQFQGLCLVASFSLAIAVGMTCIAAQEKNPEAMILSEVEDLSLVASFRKLLQTFRTMPWKVRKVCQIQFCAWMGWFPFLFYSTTYLSELYTTPILTRYDKTALLVKNRIHEDGMRIGAFSSFIFAIVALLANTVLPFVVGPDIDTSHNKKQGTSQSHNFLHGKFTVIHYWTASHILFAIAMFSTILVTSELGGTIVVGCVGLSWALTLWAPFAIIGAEIANLQEIHNCSPEDMCGRVTHCDAGVILSLHNIAISAPQIAAALGCSCVFWVANLMGSSDATGWTLRVGGLAALEAAWISRDLISGR